MGEKIRVLHLLTGLTSGGVQSVVLNYADAIQPYDVVFDYVVQKNGNIEIEEKCIEMGSRIYRIPDMMHQPVACFFQLCRLLRQHPEYRIFHVHQNDLNTVSLFAAKLADVPIRISHSHSCRPNSLWKKLLKKVNHGLLRVIATEQWACSTVAFQWLYEKKYQGRPNEYILNNAIRADAFQFDLRKREKLRAEMGLDDKFVCICVATLCHNKNQKLLLDVVAYLRHKMCREDIRLVLVGDGAIKQQLEQYAADSNIAECILFLGERRDVPELLNMADCFLLPSIFEGLPVSVIEAQANGLPCMLSYGVPLEAKITADVFFEELGENATLRWARQIIKLCDRKGKPRAEAEQILKNNNFLLNTEAERLSAKYKELFF